MGLGSTPPLPPPPTTSTSAKVHPSDDPPELDPDSYALEKFKLYETRAVIHRFKFNSIQFNRNLNIHRLIIFRFCLYKRTEILPNWK